MSLPKSFSPLWAFVALVTPFLAWADAAPATGAREGLTPFLPLALIFAVFYFLVIRPQQKRGKIHEQFLAGLKRGDLVVTASGIVGTVKLVSERFVTLEVDEGVNLKIIRAQILEGAQALKEKSTEEAANKSPA